VNPELSFQRPDDKTLQICLSGDWTLGNDIPPAGRIKEETSASRGIEQVAFYTRDLGSWDSGLLTFLVKVISDCASADLLVEKKGLPAGVQHLLTLAFAVPERKGARKETARTSVLERFGEAALAFWRSLLQMTAFVGEASIAFARLSTGKARFRRSDLFLTMEECGAQALPIVSLISLLVGLIVAFVGAIQLKIFGAQIYVASLVGIAMVRALAAIMTGIIMSGRTGASFAARLGTMQVNEEIDALKTLGISPMEFLVLPRMLALFLMMPLLSLYADLMGILGGFVIGVSMLDLNFMEYYNKTRESVSMNDFWVGLFSAAVFGVLVALSGCMRGMQCGRSASAVGEATTSAVVTSIVSIVVAMATITVICNVLNI
jgi:phospholipid/cholesterol/gamma-HCH transport system permease protein